MEAIASREIEASDRHAKAHEEGLVALVCVQDEILMVRNQTLEHFRSGAENPWLFRCSCLILFHPFVPVPLDCQEPWL